MRVLEITHLMIRRFNVVVQEEYRDSCEKIKRNPSIGHHVGAVERSA